MRVKLMRVIPATVAATVMAVAMTASPAEAHAVRVADDTVLGDLNARHDRLTVCKVVGRQNSWITVRYANPSGPGEQLIRADAPIYPSVCITYIVSPTNLANLRACHDTATGSVCTGWKPA